MSERIVIEAGGLTKAFAVGRKGATFFRFLQASFGDGSARNGGRPALRGVDLEVRQGELVGIVGGNGAGKTTLLKTIAGLYRPTAGRLRVEGPACYLAGLGVGMIGDLSVRENLFLYGAICGVERRRLDAEFEAILEWAELESYVTAPLRTLSTGMRSRLAFGITRLVEAPVLLMDEAFAAGDRRFRRKCDAFFEQLQHGPSTILVATHDMDFVAKRCSKALWMSEGLVAGYGEPDKVLEAYYAASGGAS